MVANYGIAFQPALTSRHTAGRAIDMTINWEGDLEINKKDGTTVIITTSPRNGNNPELHAVGASYGVFKLVSDPPHWSDDGR
jgi:hypothetical protein